MERTLRLELASHSEFEVSANYDSEIFPVNPKFIRILVLCLRDLEFNPWLINRIASLRPASDFFATN